MRHGITECLLRGLVIVHQEDDLRPNERNRAPPQEAVNPFKCIVLDVAQAWVGKDDDSAEQDENAIGKRHCGNGCLEKFQIMIW